MIERSDNFERVAMDTDVHKCSDYMDDDDQRSGRIGVRYYFVFDCLQLHMMKYRASLLIIVRGGAKGFD